MSMSDARRQEEAVEHLGRLCRIALKAVNLSDAIVSTQATEGPVLDTVLLDVAYSIHRVEIEVERGAIGRTRVMTVPAWQLQEAVYTPATRWEPDNVDIVNVVAPMENPYEAALTAVMTLVGQRAKDALEAEGEREADERERSGTLQ